MKRLALHINDIVELDHLFHADYLSYPRLPTYGAISRFSFYLRVAAILEGDRMKVLDTRYRRSLAMVGFTGSKALQRFFPPAQSETTTHPRSQFASRPAHSGRAFTA
jgi:hypothetical protein